MAEQPIPQSAVAQYLPTKDAYDRWAAVYDTDGNFLQGLDDIEMERLLPALISAMTTAKPWKMVDLGCGTGRNTVKLLELADIQVIGLDVSEIMLGMARQRIGTSHRMQRSNVKLATFDMLTASGPPVDATDADVVISTLVVEHIPLGVFFQTVAGMLKPGGLLLLTNMHAEMGGIGQAGFTDPVTGMKVRPTSYAHRVEDVINTASVHGFDVLNRFVERTVDENLVPRLGPRAIKYLGVRVWFGGILRKRSP